MDVRLPDGTIIKGVPDGTTKAQLAEKLKANGYDVSGLLPETKPASTGDRATALGGGVQRGMAALAGLPVDTAENIINLGIAAYGRAKGAITGDGGSAPVPMRGSFGGSEWIADKLRQSGAVVDNPRPDDPASRMLFTGGTIVGGSLVPGARTAPTAAAAGAGSVAGEALGPEWVGPAAMAPGAATQASQAARQALANRTAQNLQAFRQAGTQPTVGQATELNFLQGMENLLSKFPGGQGVFRAFAENQQKQLGNKTATGVSAEDAGRAIERGAKGFITDSKATWLRLDNELAAKVPAGTAATPTNTVQALDDLTRPIPGAKKTSEAMVNPKIAEWQKTLKDDLQANNGQLPFEALRALRSRVGAMLDDSLVTGIPGGEMKKLYGALTKDMEAAANQAGAGAEFARQNKFYAARMERIENTLERVIGKTPEETFARFMPKDANEANKVRATMRSLDPSQKQVVQDAIVSRLGMAKPGKQNEVGDVFSSETFLTNWNKLSQGAKAQIFSDPSVRQNMDALASVSSNIREGSKVFANASGSAGAAAPYGLVGMAATGQVIPAIAMVAGANIGSRMLTNPAVVEWLARAPRIKPEGMTAHLARLGVIYNETKDTALKQELGDYLNSVSKQAPRQ